MNYADAHAFLHTRGRAVPRKKYANNTYLERRTRGDVEGVALKLHNTDVVWWSHDGLMVLDTGGWLTVTTKARMNDVLPWPWVLSSTRGTWTLGNRDTQQEHRYTDGISLRNTTSGWSVVLATTLPTTQQAADDRHNDAMRKLIGKYLKDAPADWADPLGDVCNLCLGTWHPMPNTDRLRYVAFGDGLEDTQHLIDHMLDRSYPNALVVAAVTQQGYLPLVATHPSIAKRAVRSYLASRLYRGATTPVHGKKPVAISA